MKLCDEYKKKVEEKWEEPIRRRRVDFQKKCKKKSCRKLCLCCNKWFCWVAIVWYTIIEWVVRIVVKWLVYVVCRIVSSLITLFLAILFLAWLFFCTWSMPFRPGTWTDSYEEIADLSRRDMRTLEVEVIIVDESEATKNPIANAEIDARIADADRILGERAKIRVKRTGEMKRLISASLWEIDSHEAGDLDEWFKGLGLLLGRSHPRHLSVYVVDDIVDAEATHKVFYGAVFIDANNPRTTLAHELGHALLGLDVMGHSSLRGNLMYVPWDKREAAVGWPRGIPTLTPQQWCSMRQSRWLNWSWKCERCMGLEAGSQTRSDRRTVSNDARAQCA